MKLSGARIIVECLLEQGVDTVFGYPGVSIIRVYDELYKKRGLIRHILTAHEQGAAHGADAYARATGRVGVCMATSGPGATNLITGIAAAFMDSSPVVYITCNVDEALLGKDAFQEVDITGISMPITKCSYLVRSATELTATLREAFALAASGRPGPVLVDITYNATVESAEYEKLDKAEHTTQGRLARMLRRGDMGLRQPEIDRSDVKRLADMLRASERPLLLLGGGVIRSGASEAIRRFCDTHQLTSTATMMGLGAISALPVNERYLGMAGMYGTKDAEEAIGRCDLLLAIGVRFSDRVTRSVTEFAPEAKIVQIDIDRAEIDKNINTSHHIIGDARRVIELLEAELGGYKAQCWAVRSVAQPLSYPEKIVKSIESLTNSEAVIVTDVGQHQLWVCRNYAFTRPGQLICSGGYGAMGFGLGAAVGAKAGMPEAVVVHFTGDGSFRMNCIELATVKRYGLKVITVIMNNSSLGLVRQKQTREFKGHYWQTDLGGEPDYVRLAEAYGIKGRRAESLEAFNAAFIELLNGRDSGVIDCVISKNETA